MSNTNDIPSPKFPMAQSTSTLAAPYMRILRRLFRFRRWKFSVDPSAVINSLLLLFAVLTSLRSASRLLSSYAQATCISTVLIKEDDPAYQDVLIWMEDHQFSRRNFRTVLAKTATATGLGRAEVMRSDQYQPLSFNENEIVSYRLQDSNTSLQLRPFKGSHLFRFNGRWILFQHNTQNQEQSPELSDRSLIKLQCLSLSLEPLRVFIEAARLHRRKVSMSSTGIYRALATYREYFRWTRVASRPSRDISTVIFDKRKKDAILKDINEYLHPQTRRWYANHGIPYRRGYLFAGPPGTGKTSLAAAIAGVFGLDIHVLSLLDPNITESQFIRLFSEVPTRCIVLLEDIDVAGLNRPANPQPQHSDTVGGSTTQATGVSLSGLLNAIDGVSSHEGRVLIMTTNAPEKLDAALIRPGRVDMRIDFELPGRDELRSLFLSMYSDVTQQGGMKTGDLETLAAAFVEKLPEKRFSSADVQGFLLRFKRRPEDALNCVSSWVEETSDTSGTGKDGDYNGKNPL